MSKEINVRIKEIRKALRLNQVDFASKIGITQTSISQIESKKNNISIDVFIAIVNNCKANPYWLINGTGEMFSTESSVDLLKENAILKAKIEALMEAFKAIGGK